MEPYTILLRRLQQGEFPPGARMTPERQLAQELGVSRAAVRRAIARLADDGWIEARPGFRPVVRARTAAPPRNQTIALLVGSEATYRPFSQILRGCEVELRRHGYLLAFLDTWAETAHDADERGRREQEALSYVAGQSVRGVLLWCQTPDTSLPLLQRLQSAGIRIVTLDREVPGAGLDHVGVDNFRAAAAVADHLVDAGHRELGFVAVHDDNASTVRQREAGFVWALRGHGLEPAILRFPYRAAPEQMAADLAPLHAAGKLPEALFVMNDLYALRLIQALKSLELRVPEDISVVGFDDMEPDYAGAAQLTTVRQPFFELGREAVRALLQRLDEPEAPARQILLAAPLIPRATVLRKASPDVR